MSTVRYAQPGPLAVAHRGGAGLAPESSPAAFARSHALGVRWVESDVRASADGVAVLHHDRTLRRLFGRRAAVSDLTWDELRGLRTPTGERLVRPVELLDAYPDTCVTLDVKARSALPGLLADVRATGAAQRVCLAGAADALLAEAAAAEPGLVTALGWRSLVGLLAGARLRSPWPGVAAGGAYAHVPDRLCGRGVITEGLLRRAAELGVAVLVWTVDEPARMHELLDLGVGGLITDRPDLLREVLVARGQWARPVPPRRARQGCERNLASWVQ
ncbi:glycerophosphodiester phosphodiesterase [Rhodococcus aerolatus]